MAQHSRKPMPPRRSLPPLSFGDPELDDLIANDNHPTVPPPASVRPARNSLSGLTFGSIPPPARMSSPGKPAPPAHSLDAILGAIPSVPPEPTVDPSFTQAKDPSFVSAPPPPLAPVAPPPAPPSPWHVAARAHMSQRVDRVVRWLPPLPAALNGVSPRVASGLALAALWFQLGGAVRWLRNLLRLLAQLFG